MVTVDNNKWCGMKAPMAASKHHSELHRVPKKDVDVHGELHLMRKILTNACEGEPIFQWLNVSGWQPLHTQNYSKKALTLVAHGVQPVYTTPHWIQNRRKILKEKSIFL